jgi:hypothetical protein
MADGEDRLIDGPFGSKVRDGRSSLRSAITCVCSNGGSVGDALRQWADAFEESKHPRGKDGQFGSNIEDHPLDVTHKGKKFNRTGKLGKSIASGERSAEYAHHTKGYSGAPGNVEHRVWRTVSGKINEDAKMVVDAHMGFTKLDHSLAHRKGVHNPAALAAFIGRKKYGAGGMARKAAAGRDAWSPEARAAALASRRGNAHAAETAKTPVEHIAARKYHDAAEREHAQNGEQAISKLHGQASGAHGVAALQHTYGGKSVFEPLSAHARELSIKAHSQDNPAKPRTHSVSMSERLRDIQMKRDLRPKNEVERSYGRKMPTRVPGFRDTASTLSPDPNWVSPPKFKAMTATSTAQDAFRSTIRSAMKRGMSARDAIEEGVDSLKMLDGPFGSKIRDGKSSLKSAIADVTREGGTVGDALRAWRDAWEESKHPREGGKFSASSVSVEGAQNYEFANGKKPGGKGSYIFSPHKSHNFKEHGATAGEHYFQSASHTGYPDARKQAQKWAASKGHRVIHVQS